MSKDPVLGNAVTKTEVKGEASIEETEDEKLARYEKLLADGLSEAEARATVWPELSIKEETFAMKVPDVQTAVSPEAIDEVLDAELAELPPVSVRVQRIRDQNLL